MARASGIKAGIVFTDRHAYNWVDINGRAFKVDFIDYFSTMKYEGAETYCYFNSDDNWLLKEPKATPMEIFTVHHYQKALRARKAGDNKMMERCFLASVGINPNTYYPNYYLGRFYFDRNMFKDAIKYFEQALASYPKGIEALTDMCCLYNLLRKPEAALKYIDRAILLAPTFAESWLRKGIVLQNMGKLHEAMQCFKKAIKLAAGDKKLIIVCDRNIDDIRRNFRPRRPSSAD